MDIYFCPMSNEDYKKGLAGWKYIVEHETDLVQCNEALDYVAAGYVQGVDRFVINNKAYEMKKTYIDIEKKRVVHIGMETITGCDLVE